MPAAANQWKRLLLIERLAELHALAHERNDASIADTVMRASLCVDDGELAMAERMCTHVELRLVKHRVRAA
jgi:hypothetical protein